VGVVLVPHAVLMSAAFAPPETVKRSSLCFGMMKLRICRMNAGAGLASVARTV
jgi:hypothetical protein